MKFHIKKARLITVLLIMFSSCQSEVKNQVSQLVQKWEGKEILFPSNSVFTIQGKDTINCLKSNSDYKIVTYIDSIGCTSCKLQLVRWKTFIDEVDSLNYGNVSFLFYFNPKDKSELSFILRRDDFSYPVCFDVNDSINKLNHFPSDMAFQTFLLDRDNKVAAIGNPIRNLKVKELYLKIIQGRDVKHDDDKNIIETEVSVDKSAISFGHFDWQEEQKTSFTLINKGKHRLVIQDVNTSCGCTEVAYSKQPVPPGDSILLNVNYKAEHPGNFNKTVTVNCNAKSSPIVLKIAGNAK